MPYRTPYPMKASYHNYVLNFKQASGTSRGIMRHRETWFIIINDKGKVGIGECAVLKGLSIDNYLDYELKLQWVCDQINLGMEILLDNLVEFPSIQFGLETAFLSLQRHDKFELFPSLFTQHKATIPINGLIWMGNQQFMKQQIQDKLEQGFNCIKMKIGAINFATEIALLKSIRKEFSASEIELRVDANGAFTKDNALEKLKILSDLQLHSIEQPIQAKQIDDMALLCEKTPLPIALDEELIGIFSVDKKKEIIDFIKPQFIILKPSLVGGFAGSKQWIQLAEQQGIGWWITSALESNVGLNAIAQWTYTLNNTMPQGLGTGGLFTNNINSPLEVKNGALHYNKKLNWNFKIN